MQVHSIFASIILGLASTTVAQLVSCDGNAAPEWDDCEPFYNSMQSQSADLVPNLYPDCTVIGANDGVDPKSRNCAVLYCPNDASAANTYGRVASSYNFVRNNCATKAGGSTQDGPYKVLVVNNADYEPPSKMVRRDNVSRAHVRQFKKRQTDGDTGYTLVTKSDSVEGSGIQITGRLPAGSSYMISTTDSQSTGISSTVEVGASAFEIFSASVSVTVSQDYTTSNTEGITVNVDCSPGQSGQVYWYPLYTRYQGFYTPSNTNAQFDIPEDTNASGTNYRVRCLE